MDNEIKNRLLESKTLTEFNEICKKNNLKTFNDINDEKIQKHYRTLWHGGDVSNHTDPREAFE